jgi:hypothetical protein
MGGGGGGSRSIGNIQSLIDRAKQELRESETQGRRNVFISFAYEDIDEVNLLRAHAKNEKSPIEFNDWSVSEPIDSERAPYIKQKISERIAQSSVTVVYLSPQTSKSQWVAWEIEESLKRGKHVIGVYKGDVAPASLPKAFREHRLGSVRWSDLASAIAALE